MYQAWAGFAQQLADSGYAVLAIDMRGHGDTGGERDWEKAAADHALIWRQFVGREEVDKAHTAVIGGSIGANMALQLGTAQPMIKTAVLLSPGLDYRGVTTETAVQSYGNRPLLIVASEEDSYAADSSRSLLDLASPQAALQMYSGIGHGTSMLNNDPALTQTLLDWLQPILKASEM